MLGLSLKLHEEHKNLRLKWSLEKPRKHWVFSKHCHDLLYPKFLPNVPLYTDQAKFYWHLYAARCKSDRYLQKDVNNALSLTLLKALTRNDTYLKRLILSEQLINLEKFDVVSRKSFICGIINLVRAQPGLEIAVIEGLGLTKIEICYILSALIPSKKCIKYLYLWRACRKNEYIVPNEKVCFPTYCLLDNMIIHEHHWLRAVRHFSHLETLSLNYSYIATETGDILVQTAKELRKSWKCLQLLCLEDEIPGSVNAKGEKIAVTIPDYAWNEARKWSPKLKVQLVLLGIAEYDEHKSFITQSIPLRTIVLSTNVNLMYHKPCMLDCTFKTICLWYHRSLVHLHLNLWNNRDTFDNCLRKLLPCLPNLESFEFLGIIREAVTIVTMCCQVKLGVLAIKKVRLQLQKPDRLKVASIDWFSNIDCLLANFQNDFIANGVSFVVHTYPL